MSSRRHIEFILILVVHFANHILNYTLPILILYSREDIGINYTTTGILTSTLVVMLTIFALFVGFYADRSYKVRYVMMYCGTLIMSAGWYFLSQASSYRQFLIIFALIGIGSAGFHSPAMAIITDLYEEAKGRALSINMVTGMFGTAITPLLFPIIVRWSGSWQQASRIIFWYGILTVGITGLIALKMNFFSISVNPEIDNVLQGNQGLSGLSFLLSSLILLPTIFISIRSSIFRISTIFTSQVYEDFLRLSKDDASLITAVVLGLATLFIIVGGWISDRFGPIIAILISSFATFGFAALLLPQLDFHSLLGFSFFYFAINASYYIGSPATNALLANRVRAEERGRMFGLMFSFGQVVSMMMPVIFGFLKDTYGIISSFFLVFILTSIALPLGIVIYRQEKNYGEVIETSP